MRLDRFSKTNKARRGFTLVELAIVLAVSATLFAGLWRLMSSGNTQLRDQAAAEQQRQLVNAVQSYLKSSDGTTFLSTTNFPSSNTQKELILPTSWSGSTCTTTGPAALCNYLPVGFVGTLASSPTTNSYGQSYRVLVNSGYGTYPYSSYSFIVMTLGGDTIPDTSGGRITSMIGNDGGFLYSTSACGSPSSSYACGAFGAWSLNVSAGQTPFDATNIGGSSVGHILSRTMAAQGDAQLGPWLARNTSVTPPETYNTMSTDLFFQQNTALGGSSGRDLKMQGNLIALEKGQLYGSSSTDSSEDAIYGIRSLTVSMGGAGVEVDDTTTTTGPNPAVTIIGANSKTVGKAAGTTPCSRNEPDDSTSGANHCPYALQVLGNQSISGMLLANKFVASSFIYQTSSDQRLKHDIKTIDHVLDKMGKIRGVEFVFNNEPGKKYGVIAQEVEKVFPELVSGTGDAYRSVDYMGLIGPLVGAVNALKAENDDLRLQLKEQGDAIKKIQEGLASRQTKKAKKASK